MTELKNLFFTTSAYDFDPFLIKASISRKPYLRNYNSLLIPSPKMPYSPNFHGMHPKGGAMIRLYFPFFDKRLKTQTYQIRYATLRAFFAFQSLPSVIDDSRVQMIDSAVRA